MDIIVRCIDGYTSRTLITEQSNFNDKDPLFANTFFIKNGIYPKPYETIHQYSYETGENVDAYVEPERPPRVYHVEGDHVIGYSVPKANCRPFKGRVVCSRPISSFVWIEPIKMEGLILAPLYDWVEALFEEEQIVPLNKNMESEDASGKRKKAKSRRAKTS